MLFARIGTEPGGEWAQTAEIVFDREGLEYLLSQLGHIQSGKKDHIDLMTAAWGGEDLDESDEPEATIHRLKISLGRPRRFAGE
ncbi:MAG TPA: Imm32 family immunity protein [Gemmatimonadales bacterium]|nr:Imm32 family immunity protein [Gemmatimonadales bacterium]